MGERMEIVLGWTPLHDPDQAKKRSESGRSRVEDRRARARLTHPGHTCARHGSQSRARTRRPISRQPTEVVFPVATSAVRCPAAMTAATALSIVSAAPGQASE